MATKSNTKVNSPVSKLYRLSDDRFIAGVCSGLGKFFQIDATIIRLIFVVIAIFGGGGILLYLILWLIIPSDKSDSELTKENIDKNVKEIKDRAREFGKNLKINTTNANSRQLLGIVILIFGILLLLGNLHIFNFNFLWRYFPATVIIILGILILKKRE